MEEFESQLSPVIKKNLTETLTQLNTKIEGMIGKIEGKGCGILTEFENINRVFSNLQLDAASFYLNSYLSPYTDVFEELTISVQNLSKRKHGGLIVVKRNDSLEDLMSSGIPVGAKLSPALLESIFYPGSPLHDGAVLVEENMIISAGNVLPLSKVTYNNQKLGTRHRAAIGISEQSDALVLVVSEETGKISFAFNGKLYPVQYGAPNIN
ncbi:sporulation-specific diadenylate cyclase CdaS [Gottfriedia luciferensis]|uniref:sporulation-specific diadenylate cyclase CdaS n=1 Tax=Gottfriedia luciferensis TaxID=178774 RepID=UPI000B43838C|nr:sporulation-specific diadenylate cyclase CdaS [Gottfriedia luciferensis]